MMGHFLKFFRIQGLGTAGLLAGAFGAAVACGSNDQPIANAGLIPARAKPATKTVTVTVQWPDDTTKTTTNSVHVWFIAKGDSGADCPDLVGGATDPNAGPLGHLGDFVTKNVNDPITVKGVESAGATIVYVEAVDDNGQVEWAGCTDLSKDSASVTLEKARVYNCGDPGVKDGAPCDDKDPCNVGESCKGGVCQGGKARDCTALTDSCNVGKCDAVKGCVKESYNDGATCDDGLYCTTGDKCVGGACTGTPKNCDTSSGGCRTGSVCSETLLGECTTGTTQPYGTPCDDGKFCTTGDQCDFSGNCTGTPMDCSTTAGGCATCSETTHGCTDPAPVGTYCNDQKNCTQNDQCDGTGHCVGKPLDCSSYTSSDGCTVGTCEESFGSCTSITAPEGSVCNDGNACTTGDHCSGGSCISTGTAVSGAACGSPCNIGNTCEGSGISTCLFTGTYATSGTPCDDGNPCTLNDSCSFGTCEYGTYAPAGTPCTNPACPNGAQCGSSGRCGCK